MAIYIIEVMETISKTYCINVPDTVSEDEVEDIFNEMSYEDQQKAFVEEESINWSVNSVEKVDSEDE